MAPPLCLNPARDLSVVVVYRYRPLQMYRDPEMGGAGEVG